MRNDPKPLKERVLSVQNNLLPYKKGFYRVDYYDEFTNEIRTAYMTLPLYAYLNCSAISVIKAYRTVEMDEVINIPVDNLYEDHKDENEE